MSNPTNTVQVIGPAAGESLNVLGAPVVVKSNGCPGPLFFADHEVPPGYHVPPHIHEDEDELFYVLEGELSLGRRAAWSRPREAWFTCPAA